MNRPDHLIFSPRRTVLFLLLVLLFAFPAQAADEDNTEPAPAEKQKLTEAALRERIKELDLKLRSARDELEEIVNKRNEKKNKASLKAFTDDTITLPKNPTRKQCEDYVAQLREASIGQRIYSKHPAIDKLKQLPEEHYDLLVVELGGETPLRNFANYAMGTIEAELLRKGFVDNLPQRPFNIHTIVVNGWCNDARQAIIDYTMQSQGRVDPTWFQAAVEINEPKLYGKLHEMVLRSPRYAGYFINMLGALPDYNLENTANACWRRYREGKLQVSKYTALDLARAAASFGNVDALGELIDKKIEDSDSHISWSVSDYTNRAMVLRLIDIRNPNQAIRQWYNTNKDKLVFDTLRKRFVVSEDF